MNLQQRLELDRDAIYIGNLRTVDADLNLPCEGSHGSKITWRSSAEHFIDSTGKVSRPTYGRGNREVILTAVLTLEKESVSREFKATVLEEKRPFRIVRLLPITVQAEPNNEPLLPLSVIAENELKQYTMEPVTWEIPSSPWGQPTGTRTITGTVDQSEVKATAIIEWKPSDKADIQPPKQKISPFSLSDVQLLPGIFAHRQRHMIEYLLAQEEDRLLYNFREAAGLDTQGALPMTGWDAPECLLKGHTTGHYLSAIALAYACGGETQSAFKEKIHIMITELDKCQQALEKNKGCAKGFLSGYSEEQFDKLEEYVVYPKIWAPYYTLHKIIAGLLDCYLYADEETALKLAANLGLWVYNRLKRLPSAQRNKMWSMYIAGEYGGINETLAHLFRITGDVRFKEASSFFENDGLFYPMKEQYDVLGGMHANQHIPQIVGAMAYFTATGDTAYFSIAKNFWNMVTNNHCYSIGGTGEGEMFRPAKDIGNSLSDKNAESCASYNMLKLTEELFYYTADKAYMDYYEKTLWNHISASTDDSGPTGGSTYFMGLEPGSAKGFDLSENSCCHGTGLESPLKYQKNIYHTDGKSLWVSQYIPSVLHWHENNFKLTQSGDYAKGETLKFTIDIDSPLNLAITFRIPSWVKETPSYTVNGKEIQIVSAGKDSFTVERQWNKNDVIEVIFSPVYSIEYSPDVPNRGSLLYGPFVLAALSEQRDYLNLPQAEMNRNYIEQKGYTHHYGSLCLKPLFEISENERYHVYLNWY